MTTNSADYKRAKAALAELEKERKYIISTAHALCDLFDNGGYGMLTEEDSHVPEPVRLCLLGAMKGLREWANRADRSNEGGASGGATSSAPRLFVDGGAGTAGKVYCPDCIPKDLDLGSDDVEVWEEGSDSWVAVPVCSVCRSSILVVVDGDEADEDEELIEYNGADGAVWDLIEDHTVLTIMEGPPHPSGRTFQVGPSLPKGRYTIVATGSLGEGEGDLTLQEQATGKHWIVGDYFFRAGVENGVLVKEESDDEV